MNKPILMPQLSATRARTGMRSVGELVALLIKQYELQDQLRAKQQQAVSVRRSSAGQPAVRPASDRLSTPAPAPAATPGRNVSGKNGSTAEFSNSQTSQGIARPVQATFAWFDSPSSEPVSV